MLPHRPPRADAASTVAAVSRLPRSLFPDGLYHVTARGVARMTIFADDDDFVLFLALLKGIVDRLAWSVHALCLMTNHYHLVLETTRARLSAGMHRLNSVYASAFNEKYGRSGHVFGDRFGLRVVQDEGQLAAVCRYVVENPVRAGLCAHPSGWRWAGSRSRFGVDD